MIPPADMDARDTDSTIGTTIAEYRVEALLGRGGMSVVYLATDLTLHRKVALKLIAPELASDERFRERFLSESELAASLDHPNVVPIYDAGDADGVLFIAMRYVEGADVKELLAGGALSPERAIALCAQIASALDAAHGRSLVHRDVKPSNVLIDSTAGPGDHVYLADFGLTRQLTARGVGFPSGLSLGTPSYVAPEEIEGHEVDGRADQYSLGCVLYECLTGEPPFPRSTEVAVLFAHLDEEPPSLHLSMPELPEAIDGVVARALAKAPDERYPSCRDLVGAAHSALGIGKPAPIRRTALLGILASALIAVVGVLAFILVRGGGVSAPAANGDTLVRIDPATNKVTAAIPVGKNPSALAIGESGVWVANRSDGTVSRIDAETNRVTLVARAHGAPADIAVSSRHVIVTKGPVEAGVAVVDAATGAEEDLFSLASGSFFGSPSVAAGESGVWVATGDRRVGRLDLTNGTLVPQVVIRQPPDERSDTVFSAVAVSEHGVWVVGDPLDRSLWRIDPSTGQLVVTIRLPFAPKDVAFGAGSVWVTSQLDDTLSRIDPVTSEIAKTIPVGEGAAGVAFGAGSVWVANAVEGTVSRVDPRTLRVETIDVDGYPDDVAVGADAVWVTAHA